MKKPAYEAVTFSEVGNIRYLHLGTPWIQGAMNLKKPLHIELEYAQQMMAWLLFLEPLVGFHALQLGLGSAALTKFTNHLNKTIKTTAVELNPAIIIAAQAMFDLNLKNDRIQVVQANALDFTQQVAHNNQFDVLQVDIFNGEASGPALNSKQFYQGCFDVLKSPGVLTVNLFHQHSSYAKNIRRICDVFDNRVLLFKEVHDCNVVAIAFKGPYLKFAWSDLKKRAKTIQKRYQLPAKQWVADLKSNNLQSEKYLEI